MGLLQYQKSLNLNRALLSLWYRIPAASAAAARAQALTFESDEGMTNVVPLITFGPQAVDRLSQIESNGAFHLEGQNAPGIGFCNNGVDLAAVFRRSGTVARNNPPSFIGVLFTDDSQDSRLVMRIQTNQRGQQSPGEYALLTGAHHDCPFEVGNAPCCDPTFDTVDISDFKNEATLFFGGIRRPGFVIPNATDHWHHLGMSWDVGSTEIEVEGDDIVSDARLYVTHDTVTYRGGDLPAEMLDANNKMTCLVQGGRGTYIAPIGTIPTNPISIPAPPRVLSDIGASTVPVLKVEMAELRIYSGITVDTDTVTSIFVTPEGEPTLDDDEVRRQMNLIPDIQLTGSGRWRRGKNSGSGSDLIRIGTINRYKPDPSLYGAQT